MRSNRSPLGDMSSTYATNLDKLSPESQCVVFPNQVETTCSQSSNLPASTSPSLKSLEKDSLRDCWCRCLLIGLEWGSERTFMVDNATGILYKLLFT
jgi:hypothetical protein